MDDDDDASLESPTHCLVTMPRSKRARLVHESKVTKKNHREQSESLVSNIQAAVSQYDYLYVFSVDNMRNNYLKDVRTEFSKDGRFVLHSVPLLPEYIVPVNF